MRVSSIKQNLLMNFLRLITGVFFPIIILPHITKIFLPIQLGKIDYLNTIVNYYTAFIVLGIPIYGMREISINRNSKEKISLIFLEIISIICFMMLIVLPLYIFLFINGLEKTEDRIINIIFLFNIILNSIGVDWFYQGIENQKQITKKIIIFRVISIILILSFVKNNKDYVLYILFLSIGLYGGNIINFISIFKYLKIDMKTLLKVNLKKHIKSLIITFGSGIAVLLYTNTDILMIKELLNENEVSYYSFALKFIRISTVIVPVIGGTLIPRLVLYYEQTEYYEYLRKILSFILFYSLFLFLFFIFNAEQIVLIFGNQNFIKSIILIKLFSILPLFSSMSYFLGIIYLQSQKKDKLFLYIVLIAGIKNIVLNYILIQKIGVEGAVISTNISEFFIVLTIIYFERKNKIIEIIFNKNSAKFFITTILILVLFKFLIKIESKYFIFQNISLGIVYILFLYLLKEENFIIFLKKIKNMILNKREIK